jgi:cytochrome c7-like protein
MRQLALPVACVVALAACAGILGLKRDKIAVFPHRAHVIAGVACTSCHQKLTTAPDNGALHLPDDSTCTSCHQKPHDTRACSTCHTPQMALSELVEARDHLKFDHRRHLTETNGNCMRCHDGVRESDGRMRPAMATCFKCHEHDAARDARKCDACHQNLVDERALPASHLAHDGDWIREHGQRAASSGDLCETCHKPSYCASCHGQTVPALPAATRFADPTRASIHRAGFEARHSLEAKSDPGACTTCHAPDRCASCHTAKGVAGEGGRNPHPPGWVGIASSENRHGREARRDPAACAACHGGAGESLCVSCHAVGGVGGNPHPAGWSSRQPLTAMPCRLCHPNGAVR